MKIKENIEAGMYFNFKNDPLGMSLSIGANIDTSKVYKVDMHSNTKGGYMSLHRYHVHSQTGEYIWNDLVSLRRIGEKSMDYYKYDMFGKKTRGRIYYKDIDSFFYTKKAKDGKEYTKIDKVA
jgi:hypothetical protein